MTRREDLKNCLNNWLQKTRRQNGKTAVSINIPFHPDAAGNPSLLKLLNFLSKAIDEF
jgi:hypothetical protein